MSDKLQRVGLVFKADGSVDFNKSLKEVTASIQENRTAFELVKSTWDDSTKTAEKLKETQKYLSEQTKDYSDKVTYCPDNWMNWRRQRTGTNEQSKIREIN